MKQAQNNGAARRVQFGLANRERVRKAVIRAGLAGVKAKTLMGLLGLADVTVWTHLAALAKEGRIEKSGPSGACVLWGPVGIAAANAETVEARRIEAERAARAKWRKKEREKQEAIDSQAAEEWAETIPTRRVVSANDAPPLSMNAVNSVWGLAA